MNLLGKKILITGGTGSFGEAFLRHCLQTDVKEIRIFSRDEKKQHDLRKKISDKRVRYFLGDIRDSQSLFDAVYGVHYIFHAAAYKHVVYMEEFPIEAIKTNVIGTENLIQIAIQLHIEKIIFLSTDKAVEPINVMGTTKALMEKVILSKAKHYAKPEMVIVRYGNVLASRGSVIPMMVDALKTGRKMILNGQNTSRFFMTIQESIQLVEEALQRGKHGEIWIHKAQATTLKSLYTFLARKLNKSIAFEERILPTNEKEHEILMTTQEGAFAIEENNYFIIPKLDSHVKPTGLKAYTSIDHLMSEESLKNLLEKDALLNGLL